MSTMKIPKAVKLELVFLYDCLQMIKALSGGHEIYAEFFKKVLEFLHSIPHASLSTHWKSVNIGDNSNMLLSIPHPEFHAECDDIPLLSELVPEYKFVRNDPHIEATHDPLLVLRSIYEVAAGEVLNAERNYKTLLIRCMVLIAIKSARISLLLHSFYVYYIFRDYIDTIIDESISEFITMPKELDNNKTLISPLKNDNAIVSFTRLHKEDLVHKTSFVLSFGKADHGKLGFGDTQLNRLIPTVVDSLLDVEVVKVASMSAYALAITNSGKVFVWGTGGPVGAASINRNENAYSGLPGIAEFLPSKLIIADISCGLGHSLFLDNLGRVWSWGNGGNGRLGHGDLIDRPEACIIASLNQHHIIKVQCGASHSLCLSRQGEVFTWGKNSQGQCGQGSLEDFYKPSILKRFSDIKVIKLAAGWEHSLALTTDGKLYSWGSGYKDNRRGVIPPVLGLGHSESRTNPEQLISIDGINIIDVASGWDHCLALDENGKLLSWGSGQNGKLGHGNEENIALPCYISALDKYNVTAFSAGCEHSAAIIDNGDIFTWGHAEGGRLGAGTNTAVNTPQHISIVDQMLLRSKFVHCGDKFTILVANKDVQVHSQSCNSRISSHWIIEEFYKNLHGDFIHRTSTPPSSLRLKIIEEMSLKSFLSNIPEAEKNTPNVCLGIESISFIAGKLLLTPSTKGSPCDSEFSIENSEDTLVNASLFLVKLSSLYASAHEKILSSPASPEIENIFQEESTLQQHHIAFLIYHLMVILSSNFASLSQVSFIDISSSQLKERYEYLLRREPQLETTSLQKQVDSEAATYDLTGLNGVNIPKLSSFNEEGGLSCINDGIRCDRDFDDAECDLSQNADIDDDNSFQSSSNLKFSNIDGNRADFDNGSVDEINNKLYMTPQKSIPIEKYKEDIVSDGKGLDVEFGYSEGSATELMGQVVLSPAPSYESLESNGNEDAMDAEFSQITNKRDFFCFDSYRKASEDENEDSIEMQQALLMSIDSIQLSLSDQHVLFPVDKRRDYAPIPQIRNTLNTLASVSFMCIQQLQSSNAEGSSVQDINSIYAIISRRCFLIWETVQLTTAVGFSCLYDKFERQSVLSQILRSSSSFLYIIPGIIKGIQNSVSLDIAIKELFHTDMVKFLGDLNSDERFLTIEDIVQMLNQLIALFQSDNCEAHCFECLKALNKLILESFVDIILAILQVPISSMLLSSSSLLENQELTTRFPWGQKMQFLVDQILESCLASIESQNGSFYLLSIITLLFNYPERNWQKSDAIVLLPIYIQISLALKASIDEERNDSMLSKVQNIAEPFIIGVVEILMTAPFFETTEIFASNEKLIKRFASLFSFPYASLESLQESPRLGLEIQNWSTLGNKVELLCKHESFVNTSSAIAPQVLNNCVLNALDIVTKMPVWNKIRESCPWVWNSLEQLINVAPNQTDLDMCASILSTILAYRGQSYVEALSSLNSSKVAFTSLAFSFVIIIAVAGISEERLTLINDLSSLGGILINIHASKITSYEMELEKLIPLIERDLNPTDDELTSLASKLIMTIERTYSEVKVLSIFGTQSFWNPSLVFDTEAIDSLSTEGLVAYSLSQIFKDKSYLSVIAFNEMRRRNEESSVKLVLWIHYHFSFVKHPETSLHTRSLDIISERASIISLERITLIETFMSLLDKESTKLSSLLVFIESDLSLNEMQDIVRQISTRLSRIFSFRKYFLSIDQCNSLFILVCRRGLDLLLVFSSRIFDKDFLNIPASLVREFTLCNSILSKGLLDIDVPVEILNKVVRLAELSIDLVAKTNNLVQRHIWHSIQQRSRYIWIQRLPLECTSPTISIGKSSANGEFSVKFWLFIPETNSAAVRKEKHLHILSRIPETGEIDMIELLTRDPEESASYSFAIHLVPTDLGYIIQVSVITFYYIDSIAPSNRQYSSSKRTRKINRLNLKSKILPTESWIECLFEVDQKGIHASSNEKRRDLLCTSALMIINRKEQCRGSIFGLPWPLYQTLVVGKIPVLLGADNSPDKLISLADVLWIPTINHLNALSDEITGDFVTFPIKPPSEIYSQLNSFMDCTFYVLSILSKKLREYFNQSLEILQRIETLLNKAILFGDRQLMQLAFASTRNLLQNTSLDNSNYCYAKTVFTLVWIVSSLINSDSFYKAASNKSFSISIENYFEAWLFRLFCWRAQIGNYANCTKLMESFIIDESLLFCEISSVFSLLITSSSEIDILKGLLCKGLPLISNSKYQLQHKSETSFSLILLSVQGGYYSTLRNGCNIIAWPIRSLSLRPISLNISDCLAFTSSGVICILDKMKGRSVQIEKCDGASVLSKYGLVPSFESLFKANELLLTEDNFTVTKYYNLPDKQKSIPSLKHLFQLTKNLMNQFNPRSKTNLTKQNSKDCANSIDISSPIAINNEDNGLSDFLLISLRLRSLALQLSLFLNYCKRDMNYSDMEVYLHDNFQEIFSLASLDPVSIVESFLDPSFSRSTHFDAVRSVIKEADLIFLEKFKRLFWEHFHAKDIISYSSDQIGPQESAIQLVALAGDITVCGSKVRAISHFPSIRLSGVGLERMTGRWFYECTLLSDGLMQIGWANSLFRCDPICGQGVGDHQFSYAMDGLRCKKWNVSCESYGKRWHLGDVIGALVDMDLLEMRFYLNGEDLGAAFEDFASHDLFPAFSLNVRQSIRVNFGQYRFSYPPDTIDGKPFRGIINAFESPLTHIAVQSNKQLDDKDACESNISIKYRSSSNTPPIETSHDFKIEEQAKDYRETSLTPQDNDVTVNAVGSDIAGVRATEEDIRSADLQNAEFSGLSVQQTNIINRSREEAQPRDDYNSEEDEDGAEGNEDNEDQQYILSSRWQDDFDARIRMEADDGEEFEEEDDDDDDVRDGDEDGREDNESEGEEQNIENDEDDSNHLVELRRQAMIESLIGMGFPIDWAIRAAEHCDGTTSESAAIAWIIERMEIEQAKANEVEDDISRNRNEENSDEGINDLEFLISRQAVSNAINSNSNFRDLQNGSDIRSRTISSRDASQGAAAASRRLVVEHMAELLENAGSGLGGALSPGSPVREESFNNHRGLTQAALGLMLTDDAAYAAFLSAKLQTNNRKTESSIDKDRDRESDGFDLLYTPNVAWNKDSDYFTILPGIYSQPRTNDIAKQDLLNELSCSEALDFSPIIIEFVLCLYYAKHVANNYLHTLAIEEDYEKNKWSHDKITMGLTVIQFISSVQPLNCVDLIKSTFLFHLASQKLPERLFPSAGIVHKVCADKRERTPLFEPFITENHRSLVHSLCALERLLFTSATNSISMDTNSMSGLLTISNIVRSATRFSLKIMLKPANLAEDGKSEGSTISSSLSGLQDIVMKRAGLLNSDSPDTIDTLSSSCNSFLDALIQSSLEDLDRASSSIFDSQDWIGGSDSFSEERPSSSPSSNTKGTKKENKPVVLFSFWSMRIILTEILSFYERNRCDLSVSGVGSSTHTLEEGLIPKTISLRTLISPETFAKLIKISNCNNDSLRFCVYELCSLIIGIMNCHLKSSLSSKDCSVTSMLQVAAAEYYVSVSKEKRLLHSLGVLMKLESPDKLLVTRYAQVCSKLLIQWYLLRRYMNLSTFTYMAEFKRLNMNVRPTIRVTQITSTNIAVSWKLESSRDYEKGESNEGLSLFITTLSHMGMEMPLLVLSNIEKVGAFRIEDLEPDTLYKINIRREINHGKLLPSLIEEKVDHVCKKDFSNEVALIVATDSEATFGFQSDSVSPNILITSGQSVTLRNISNKKWSTARANVRLSSGVHRWDVHIDRCVSKNIFIGVSTREARLDNYVGCDAFGWAFLANRAVWHNKTKLQTYGELFRTGDTVTVILDLDIGTLSFSLNDQHLGVAVEGLSGPLYPTFSLYNEDDQVTVAQVRCVRDNPVSCGSFAAENTLDRLEALRLLTEIFNSGSMLEKLNRFPGSLLSELAEEVSLRWNLWSSNVGVRTISTNGSFCSIVLSDSLCQTFSAGRLHLQDLVCIEKRTARVVGVGGCKLWLRIDSNGELIALTFDTYTKMLSNGLLECTPGQEVASEGTFTYTTSCFNNLNPIVSDHFKGLENLRQLSFDDVSSMIVTQIQTWTSEDDFSLWQFISTITDNLGESPFTLSMSDLSAILSLLDNSNSYSTETMKNLISKHSITDILLRCLLLNMFNDLLLALFPLIASLFAMGNHTGHPLASLARIKAIIYPIVKDQAACYLSNFAGTRFGDAITATRAFFSSASAASALSSEVNDMINKAYLKNIYGAPIKKADSVKDLTHIPATSLLAPVDLSGSCTDKLANLSDQTKESADSLQESSFAVNQPLLYKDRPILWLRKEDEMLRDLLRANEEQHLNRNRDSKAWKLVSLLQTSFPGQMIHQLQALQKVFSAGVISQSSSSGTGTRSSSVSSILSHLKDSSLWESILRVECLYMRSPWPNPSFQDKLSGSCKYPPLIIRAASCKSVGSAFEMKVLSSQQVLQCWLSIAQIYPDINLDYPMFLAFLDDSMCQLQQIFDLVFLPETLNALGASETSLLLLVFHIAGVLVGLSIRGGSSPFLKLPNRFIDILSGESKHDYKQQVNKQDCFQDSCAQIFRSGLCSVFPESVWNLWTKQEIEQLLSNEGLSASALRRRAYYEDGVSSSDSHIQFFWICLYNLSGFHLRLFFLAVNNSHNQRMDIPYIAFSPTDLSPYLIKILPPTAVALLDPNSAQIVFFPERGGVSIPRFSSFKVTQEAFQSMLKMLSG